MAIDREKAKRWACRSARSPTRSSWTGLSLEEIESAGKTVTIFALGILVVYLTLAAQYESFALPFIILLAVPMAVLGALLAQSLRGLPNDVYCQIGLVMLIGLSAKIPS